MVGCYIYYPSSGSNRAVLTDVVGGSIVRKSFMDRLLLMSPSIFLFSLHYMGLEVCVLTESVQQHTLGGELRLFFSQLHARFYISYTEYSNSDRYL